MSSVRIFEVLPSRDFLFLNIYVFGHAGLSCSHVLIFLSEGLLEGFGF